MACLLSLMSFYVAFAESPFFNADYNLNVRNWEVTFPGARFPAVLTTCLNSLALSHVISAGV